LAYVEVVKECREEQKHFTPRRKDAKGAKRTKQLYFASLRALAPWREIFQSFRTFVGLGWIRTSRWG
jgi:hypothetical protein